MSKASTECMRRRREAMRQNPGAFRCDCSRPGVVATDDGVRCEWCAAIAALNNDIPHEERGYRVQPGLAPARQRLAAAFHMCGYSDGEAIRLLQAQGLISDNCLTLGEVATADCHRAALWLELNRGGY